jgi:hypothetical protein
MPSFIWTRSLEDAFDEPYEYPAQEQFIREAETVLTKFKEELSKYDMQFVTTDKSAKRAVWMLVNDASDSLTDCLLSIKDKRHKIAGKMYRDVIETLDLAAYLNTDTVESNKHLTKWYNDELIPNRVYRDYIKKTKGENEAKEKSEVYSDFSKFTHRTYHTLLFGYGVGVDNKMYYDGYKDNDILIQPTTISMYYVYLRHLIFIFSLELSKLGLIDSMKIDKIWEASLEKESAPRRFISPKEVFEKMKKGKKEKN